MALIKVKRVGEEVLLMVTEMAIKIVGITFG